MSEPSRTPSSTSTTTTWWSPTSEFVIQVNLTYYTCFIPNFHKKFIKMGPKHVRPFYYTFIDIDNHNLVVPYKWVMTTTTWWSPTSEFVIKVVQQRAPTKLYLSSGALLAPTPLWLSPDSICGSSDIFSWNMTTIERGWHTIIKYRSRFNNRFFCRIKRSQKSTTTRFTSSL